MEVDFDPVRVQELDFGDDFGVDYSLSPFLVGP